jgi:hypothetical protein
MLDSLLLIRLLLAFAVGSIWVAAITVITERKGTTWGILGGLPSTAAFSLFFIGINQSAAAAVDATVVLPLIFSVSNAFLLLYAVSARKGFVFGLCVSLLVWFVVSALIVCVGFSDYTLFLAVGAAISVLTFLAFRRLRLPSFEGQGKLYGKKEILIRGAVAGTLVATSVLLSQIGGPILGGVAAAFPAIYTSTIIILKHSKGTEYSRSMTKPLAISGILTVIPYSITVHYLYPTLGVYLGTLLAYMAVTPLAILSYYVVKRSYRNT